MSRTNVIFLTSIVLAISGCSTDSFNRISYETVQNVRKQQCLKNTRSDCSERESYEAYQGKLKELKASKTN